MIYEHDEKQDLRGIADCGWFSTGHHGRRWNRIGILGVYRSTNVLREGELDFLRRMGPNKGPFFFLGERSDGGREKRKLLYGKVAQTGRAPGLAPWRSLVQVQPFPFSFGQVKGENEMNTKMLIPKLKRASPTILTILGAAGVVGTAVLAVKATPKAMQLIEEADYEKRRDQDDVLTPMETVKVAWKSYIPAASVGLATIVCIIGANGLNRKQQAAITSAYILLDNAYKEYRKKVKELYGEDSDRHIRSEIVKDHYEHQEPAEGKLLFFDFFSGRYLERTAEQIVDAEYHLNREFVHKDYVTLNEWYEFLGLDPVDFGDVLGWSIGAGENFYNYQWIDFEHELETMDDGLECYIIHMVNPPSADFMDYC